MKKLVFILLLSQHVFGQELEWKKIDTHIDASFRGLSVVDDHVAWVGGTNGTIGRSVDGGITWKFVQVKEFEKNDFRSIYAFDSLNVVIANAGSPAYILRTSDGGKTWKVVYENNDSAAFFDGIDFWNIKEGVIYGDPIKGKMLLLKTGDGGRTWKKFSEKSRPVLENGEASFAASGTGIRCLSNSRLVITTGGKVSRLFISEDKGAHWVIRNTPVMQGESSTGIFSVAFLNDHEAVIVGGDYNNDSLAKDNVFFTIDTGKTWRKPVIGTRGYRECAEYIDDQSIIALGPTGADLSNNRGFTTWKMSSNEKGFHVIRKSRRGKLIIAAGSNGQISILQFEKHLRGIMR
jgi:photosystem II stability/assembly factor-like uncharacterized protein